MVQIWDPRWDWRDPTRVKHRLLGGIGRILHGTKLGTRVGLEGSHLGFEARFHAGFCLECSWDRGWDWRDPTCDSRRDPMWEVPKSRSGSQVGLAGSHPGSNPESHPGSHLGSQAGLAGSRLTFFSKDTACSGPTNWPRFKIVWSVLPGWGMRRLRRDHSCNFLRMTFKTTATISGEDAAT